MIRKTWKAVVAVLVTCALAIVAAATIALARTDPGEQAIIIWGENDCGTLYNRERLVLTPDGNTSPNNPVWGEEINQYKSTIKSVTFSVGFNNLKFTPTGSLVDMFKDFTALEYIDFRGLDTSNVTNMAGMFQGCTSLKRLDLTTFNTSKVLNMSYMFYGCSSLGTVFAGDGWTTSQITASNRVRQMFYGCNNLVGGHGTAFDASYIDNTYARIDRLGSKGYFSEHTPYIWEQDRITDCWYRIGEDGMPLKNAWGQWNGAWYRFGDDEIMLDGEWFFDGTDWFYLKDGGEMAANEWLQLGDKWYYFKTWGGAYCDEWAYYKGAYYHFGDDCAMQANAWVYYKGAWYHMGKNGKAEYNAWVKEGSKYYYVGSNGKMVTNTWITYQGKQYHFNSSGVCDKVR